VMLAIYVRAARMEEQKFARSPLAAAYERYRSQTGMLLPNPAKLFRAR
jgi:protein-S-isoprenylcysteine O-methyltransferase Ste14